MPLNAARARGPGAQTLIQTARVLTSRLAVPVLLRCQRLRGGDRRAPGRQLAMSLMIGGHRAEARN
jgi:hypothetical protein